MDGLATQLNKLSQHYILAASCCRLYSHPSLEEYIQSYHYKSMKRDPGIHNTFSTIMTLLHIKHNPYIKDLALVCKDWFQYLSILIHRYFVTNKTDIVARDISSTFSIYKSSNITQLYICFDDQSQQGHGINLLKLFPNLRILTIYSTLPALPKCLSLVHQIKETKPNSSPWKELFIELYLKINKNEVNIDLSVEIQLNSTLHPFDYIHVEYQNSARPSDSLLLFLAKNKPSSFTMAEGRQFDNKPSYIRWDSLKYLNIGSITIKDLHSLLLENKNIVVARASVPLMEKHLPTHNEWELLCQLLSTNTTIQELYLRDSHVHISTQSETELSISSQHFENAITANKTLTRLAISCNGLSKSFYTRLSSNCYTSIYYLELIDINLEHLQHVGEMLVNNTTLKELDVVCIRDSRLADDFYTPMDQTGYERTTQELYSQHFETIQKHTLRVFVDGVKANKTLQHLYMSSDSYSDSIVSMIETEITAPTLDDIYLIFTHKSRTMLINNITFSR